VGHGAGGGHTVTATGPVQYEIEGHFYPATEGCTFKLVVTEKMLFSKVREVQSSLFGAIPTGPGGLGEDQTTVFRPEFDQESKDFFIIAGNHVTSFSLYDIALPEGTGCDFTR